MSLGNTAENEILALIFKNTTMALVGDATGLVGSTTAGSFYISLHTADPGEGGNQTTSECSYALYARIAVARSGAGWVVTANSVSPAATIVFGAAAIGDVGTTVTHFAVGTASSGAGKIICSGTVTPNIALGASVVPELSTATAITLD